MHKVCRKQTGVPCQAGGYGICLDVRQRILSGYDVHAKGGFESRMLIGFLFSRLKLPYSQVS